MAAAGDLADFGPSDLLYMIKMRGMTGRLTLQRGEDDATLSFQQGRLVRVTSSRISQRLGELLVYLGRLSEEQLGTALARQAARPGAEPLGALLIGQGLVTSADLDEVLRCQAEEILLRVLAWAEGTFAYEPEPETGLAVPLPEINVEQLILEAVRQGDEWEAIRRRIPSLDCGVTVCSQPSLALAEPLSLKASIVVASIARGASRLRDVAEVTRLAEREVIRLVDELAGQGVVTVTPPATLPATPPAVEPAPGRLAGLGTLRWGRWGRRRSSYAA